MLMFFKGKQNNLLFHVEQIRNSGAHSHKPKGHKTDQDHFHITHKEIKVKRMPRANQTNPHYHSWDRDKKEFQVPDRMGLIGLDLWQLLSPLKVPSPTYADVRRKWLRQPSLDLVTNCRCSCDGCSLCPFLWNRPHCLWFTLLHLPFGALYSNQRCHPAPPVSVLASGLKGRLWREV